MKDTIKRLYGKNGIKRKLLNRVFTGFGNFFQLFKDYVTTHTAIIIRNVIIILLLFSIVSVGVSFIVFITFRRGKPEVSVPNVAGRELIDGLIELQKKKLYVVIDPRYFSNYPKNIIVEQEPKPGSIVREGREVNLIVSKGPIISIVEDYKGKTLAYVRNRLEEIFSFQGKTIEIGNITYVSSDAPKGTVVGQYPPPNTPIGSVDKIDLIISRGNESESFYLKNYVGKDINDVMQKMALRGVLIHVIPENIEDPQKNGIILSQEPEKGALVKRNETVTFHVGYLPSEVKTDKLYARVVNFDLPPNIESGKEVNVRILVKDKAGEREVYNAKNKGGDSISIPFKSYSPTTIYIYVNEGLYEVRKLE